MTFTTRDKILLGVLAVILFVGMMYLYGVMPADEEAEKLATQATQKQQELNELLAQIAAIDITSLEEDYDELLDYYYETKEDLEGSETLPEKVGIIAIERMIIGMLDDAGIEGYSTTGWKIEEERLSAAYDTYTVDYYIAHATCPIPFEVDPDKLHAFIDVVKDNPFFVISEITINYTTKSVATDDTTGEGADPDAGDDTGATVVPEVPVAEGTMTLVYYMAAKEDAATGLPALLPEVTGLSADGATVTFNTVDNAVEYEFYTVAADGSCTLIKNFTVKDNGENTMSVKFSSAHLSAGVNTIAVRAVGDKSAGYFKSPKPDADTATVTVAI